MISMRQERGGTRARSLRSSGPAKRFGATAMDASGTQMQNGTVTAARLRTPRAAAIAGILFSVLLMTSLVLLRLSVPGNPLDPGAWLETDANRVAVALNLVPFAGIGFLWFIGVLR